jgi:hypothetical protein
MIPLSSQHHSLAPPLVFVLLVFVERGNSLQSVISHSEEPT